MKKALALLLALVLVLSLAACGESGGDRDNDRDKSSHGSDWNDKTDPETTDGPSAEDCGDYESVTLDGYDHQFKKYANMAKGPVTLTYLTTDEEAVVRPMVDAFMAIYPNITVNVEYIQLPELAERISQGLSGVDALTFADMDSVLSTRSLLDISEYWNSDEETKNLASTVNSAGLGTYGLQGGQRYAVPTNFYPQPVFVDRNVLKTLNIPIPGRDWTWDEMIDIIKAATGYTEIDGMRYYGLSGANALDGYYNIAAGQDIIGAFGYDGRDFDFTVWAMGEREYTDLKLGTYMAPSYGSQEYDRWLDDAGAWAQASGHVAVFTEPFYLFQSFWNKDEGGETNMEKAHLDIIPYVAPAVKSGDAQGVHNTPATMDFGGVAAGTEHPREAYELLKFMTFGVDGWAVRCALYGDSSLLNADGEPLRTTSMSVPLTTDEEIWEKYIDVFCQGMDEEHTQHWRDFFAASMQPIPTLGQVTIPGYMDFIMDYMFPLNITGLVESGQAQAADYADEATRKANWYHADAMLRYFGPEGYNVLTDEETAFYNDLLNDNA